MVALFAALNLSALFLAVVWFGVYVQERAKARALPPGMLAMFHRERAHAALRNFNVSLALGVASLVGDVRCERSDTISSTPRAPLP